jgi:hypothetical protein
VLGTTTPCPSAHPPAPLCAAGPAVALIITLVLDNTTPCPSAHPPAPLCAAGPAVALIITLVLDNTMPGTDHERGLHAWRPGAQQDDDWWEDDYMNRVGSCRAAAGQLRALELQAAALQCWACPSQSAHAPDPPPPFHPPAVPPPLPPSPACCAPPPPFPCAGGPRTPTGVPDATSRITLHPAPRTRPLRAGVWAAFQHHTALAAGRGRARQARVCGAGAAAHGGLLAPGQPRLPGAADLLGQVRAAAGRRQR